MNIPDEAIEAAARALDPHTMGSGGALAEKFKDATRAEARRVLEAAAPLIITQTLRAAIAEVKEANDHIQASGGDGYASGFHYALSCVEAAAIWSDQK